jgi:hypothetical protein
MAPGDAHPGLAWRAVELRVGSAQWVNRSSGDRVPGPPCPTSPGFGGRRDPAMRNVWVIFIIAILAVVLAAAWIVFVQPHLQLHHG